MSPDKQEALSVKYNVARIVRLTSGHFALFSPYTGRDLGLLGIGTLAHLEALIPVAGDCSTTYIPPDPKFSQDDNRQGKSLLKSLGLVKPIERRL